MKGYGKANSNTVIKVLLRCKKLYQAMTEIKKILQLVLKETELFSGPNGTLYKCIKKYNGNPSAGPVNG